MKLLLLTFVSCLVLLAESVLSEECDATSPHSFQFGSQSNGDELLYSTLVKIDKVWFMIRDKDISWPLPGQLSDAQITQVVVENQLKGDTGGCTEITEGGPGFPNVTLHITTQRGEGAQFLINVYGTGY